MSTKKEGKKKKVFYALLNDKAIDKEIKYNSAWSNKKESFNSKEEKQYFCFVLFCFLIKKRGKLLSWLMRKLRAFTEERMNISGHPGRLQRRESVRANVLQEEAQP